MCKKLLIVVAIVGLFSAFFSQLPTCYADWRQMREEAEDRRRFMEEIDRLNREEWQRADEQAQENIRRQTEKTENEDNTYNDKEDVRRSQEAERQRQEEIMAEQERKRQEQIRNENEDRKHEETIKNDTRDNREKNTIFKGEVFSDIVTIGPMFLLILPALKLMFADDVGTVKAFSVFMLSMFIPLPIWVMAEKYRILYGIFAAIPPLFFEYIHFSGRWNLWVWLIIGLIYSGILHAFFR